MRVVTEPLKGLTKIDPEEWIERAHQTHDFILPDDEDGRLSLIYRLFLSVHEKKSNMVNLGMAIRWGGRGRGLDDSVRAINDHMMTPFTREVGYRLDDMIADSPGDQAITRESLMVFHYHGGIHNVQPSRATTMESPSETTTLRR